MQRFLLFIGFIFLIAVFLMALDRDLFRRIYEYKYAYTINKTSDPGHERFSFMDIIFLSDGNAMGDLYAKSFLPQFRIYKDIFRSPVMENKIKCIDLYIVGDSYLAGKDFNNAFVNVRHVYFIDRRWDITFPEPKDKSVRNVIILEYAERNLTFSRSIHEEEKLTASSWVMDNKYWKFLERKVFHGLTEQNLEFLLFDYPIFRPFKESKAWLNYKLFDRTNKEVLLSSDEKQLYLGITADPKNPSSSIYPLSDENIDNTIKRVNELHDHLATSGFDESFLSIVPNTVSIYEKELKDYNFKIERIENSALLKMKTVSVYPIFKRDPGIYFMVNDSHWNNKGFNVWINEVNKLLIEI